MSAISSCLVLRAKLRDGSVERVEIVSPRADPSPVFIGLAPEEAAALAGRLFSLCPVSQSLAARMAGEAALEVETDAATQRRRALGLLCERLGEMLRASLLDWPSEAPPAPEDILRLREALNILRALPATGGERLSDLRAATQPLGLGDANERSVFGRQIAEARDDAARWRLPSSAPDFLSAADDADVFAAMTRDRAFSRAPQMPGRHPETGASARRCAAGGLAEKLAARRADMTATVETIDRLLKGGDPPADLAVAQGANGQGFAAVDSARGRLYHAVRLDDSGRIADYRIVAPTEWNFHPDGPFVRALRGASIDAGAESKKRIERLAFVFDPCIRVVAEILA
jgi:uptake hydrogenase large subunit